MALRELMPWGRQTETAPTTYRGEQSNPFLSFRREVDRLFDDMLGRGMPSLGYGSRAISWPNVEVNETENEVRITAEMPGMNEKDIELHVEDGVLTLSGERKSETEDKDRGYSERFYGRFERRIGLPLSATEEGCDATFRDGVLTVTLPKSPERERSRRIPINAQTHH